MGQSELEARLDAMRKTIKTADRQTDIWEPKEGDEIVGVIVTKRTVEFDDRDSAIYDFDVGSRTQGVWDSTDISRQFTSLKVRYGDIVGLRYLGVAGKNKMKLFVVSVDHVDPEAELVCPPPEPKKKGNGNVAVDDNVPF